MKSYTQTLMIQAFTVLFSVFLLLLKPLPDLWMNIACYLLAMAGATVFLWLTSKKPLNEVDKEAKEVQAAMEKLNFEVQVASSQVASVSEQLYITLDENNSFANTVFLQTRDMAELNRQVNENIRQTVDVVKHLMETLEEGIANGAVRD